jgi:hypothetical protein
MKRARTAFCTFPHHQIHPVKMAVTTGRNLSFVLAVSIWLSYVVIRQPQITATLFVLLKASAPHSLCFSSAFQYLSNTKSSTKSSDLVYIINQTTFNSTTTHTSCLDVSYYHHTLPASLSRRRRRCRHFRLWQRVVASASVHSTPHLLS